jgi:signal transduction histidine kinase/ligand-binding sensor domain-containing protein/AraC-like DNA-binding protein
MRLKILILWVLITPFCLFAQVESFQFSNLSVRDGLSQNTVIRILQDSKNYMWFCTRDGLNRYDGTSFKVYRFSLSNENSISSSDVTSISENKDGTFWIGTHNGLNHFDPQKDKFIRYFHSETDKNSPSSSTIKLLLTDKSGNTWISTTKGLDLYDKKTNTFKHIYTNDAVIWVTQRANGDICFASVRDGLYVYNTSNCQLINYPLPANDYIYSLFEDSNHDLWAGMWSNSLKKWNPVTKKFEQVPLNMAKGKSFDHEQIGYMVEYKPGFLMLATRKGLLIYNTKSKTVIQRLSSKNNQLKDEKVITLYKDKSKNIWIGSWNGGIDFYSPFSNYFKQVTPILPDKELVGCINSITEINGLLWMATDNGLIAFNRQTNNYQVIPLKSESAFNEVKSIFRDNDKLWVSIYAGGLHVLNLNSKKIERTIANFNFGYVKSMTKDGVGNYWIATGTNDPFLMYDNKNNLLIKRFEIKGSKQLFAPVNVQDVILEKDQTIWVGTRADGLYRYNFKTKELSHFVAIADSTSISNNHVSVLFKDSKNNLWVGTYGGGICLYNSINNTFRTFDNKNGLLNNAICGIVEDKDQSLWISTLEGISHFYPRTKNFDNYNNSNGYPIQETVPHGSIKLADNTIIVGGVNSFVSFNPSDIVKNPIVPNIVISKFKVWADNVSEIASTSESIYPNKEVQLKYYQAAFTIYFAALNYVFPNKNQYSYMLEGFDKNWNSVINERSATYTNIPPGHYTFHVKACNNDGIWNNVGTSFDINILPPPWKTWWAYFIYFILIVAILSGFIYYILNKQKLETDITIKQIEQRNLEDNHQLRVRLFTNFSHELRTPLTLIIGPLNEILSKNELPQWLRPKLELIFKNAQRLLWLVNQLMDFRKLESGFMKPNVSQVDFNLFVEDILLSFKELATTKEISIELENKNKNIDTWFDPILLEKVFFNLLSNAFKHTNVNGEVKILVDEIDSVEIKKITNAIFPLQGALFIQISDNGNGIELHEIEKIFEPFYQAHNHEGANIYGTGIGLNLCKGIVEIHSGKIWAESELGKGSTFKILLPLGNAHFSASELSSLKTVEHDRSVIIDLPDNIQPVVLGSTQQELKKKDNFTVLVVEDNEDVRHYVRSLLIDNYRILEAEDCAIGCKMAIEFVPDLIISDIMTPNKSGIELCNELKNNEVTNHIPIILLTALSGLEQVKEGLNSLADDYIVKPFNPELLQLRVNNLISIRRRIRDSFNKHTVYGNINTDLPSAEDKFINKVFDYIKKNIDNPDLRIDSFSKDVGMSRVQFYRKIKSITGKTPSSLILEIRMIAAAELIKKTDNNINEIAYQVGFNDSSYFGKCFKIYFGVTPSDYKV